MKSKDNSLKLCIDYYKEFFKATKKAPTLLQLDRNGFTRGFLRQNFGSKYDLDAHMEELMSAQAIPEPKNKYKARKKVRTFLVTGVQNNTPVNTGFMSCLETYAEYLGDTAIIGMPIYYRNPTSIEEHQVKKEYWWDKAFTGKFVTDRLNLSSTLTLMAEHRVQATAAWPLASLENLSGERSAIYAHSQCARMDVATSGDIPAKEVHTTMSCCEKTCYSESNAGGKAKFHHVIGALIIEIDEEGTHYIRQLNYDGKGFYDLDAYVKQRTVSTGHRAAGLVFGDLHSEVIDQEAVRATFIGPTSLMGVLKPKVVVCHDVLDFVCQSHHNLKNALLKYLLAKNKKDDVASSIEDCGAVIDLIDDKKTEIWVADSNHHDHLTRWINEADWKKMSPRNAKFYLSLVVKLMENMRLTPALGIGGPSAFELALKEVTKKRLVFLDPNKEATIAGIGVPYHGHVGPNGSRGSISAFAKVGSKVVIGHGHTAGIRQGVFQVAKKCIMTQNYMSGPSSHSHTDCVIHSNGKRALITIKKGKIRGR